MTETTRTRHFDEEIYGFGDADEFEQVLAMIEEDRRFVEKTGARTLAEVALVCDHVPWLIAQLRASRSSAPSEGPTSALPVPAQEAETDELIAAFQRGCEQVADTLVSLLARLGSPSEIPEAPAAWAIVDKTRGVVSVDMDREHLAASVEDVRRARLLTAENYTVEPLYRASRSPEETE